MAAAMFRTSAAASSASAIPTASHGENRPRRIIRAASTSARVDSSIASGCGCTIAPVLRTSGLATKNARAATWTRRRSGKSRRANTTTSSAVASVIRAFRNWAARAGSEEEVERLAHLDRRSREHVVDRRCVEGARLALAEVGHHARRVLDVLRRVRGPRSRDRRRCCAALRSRAGRAASPLRRDTPRAAGGERASRDRVGQTIEPRCTP